MKQQKWHQPRLNKQHSSHRYSKWTLAHIDGPLLILLLVLLSFGLVTLYSASGQNIDTCIRQAIRIGMGLVLMLSLAQIKPAQFQRWSPALYIFGLMLLIGVLVIGIGAKGAQRWLHLPGFGRFQPSEMMKLALPMMVAWYLARGRLPLSLGTLAGALVLILIPMLLILKQPDLGTALLIGCSGFIVLLMAGLSFKILLIFMLTALPLAAGFWTWVMHAYQKQRVLTFLDPESDPLGSGWNIIQSKIAIGGGGLHGKGWLQGTQSQFDFLPEGQTDFILAVLAEEWGLVGIIMLMGLYLAVIARGTYIASRAQETYTRLLASGIVFTFFVYLFVNMGMVSGLLPVVGVPLPLISYGGTSIITLLGGFGILMAIHTRRKLM